MLLREFLTFSTRESICASKAASKERRCAGGLALKLPLVEAEAAILKLPLFEAATLKLPLREIGRHGATF